MQRDPRILFIAPGDAPDYQCDTLFHGLKSLLGENLVDICPPWYMYRPTEQNRARFPSLYGKGFTLYGLLEESPATDRTDIEAKIRARHFDLVVFGSIHRSQQYLFEVLDRYSMERIAFVDGEDETGLFRHVLGRGRYFKREIADPWMIGNDASHVLPIGFGIPRQKIVDSIPAKTRLVAHIDPRDKSTYIYGNETDYYQGYRESCFGITTKKAGWDCMRHYEILANGCFPVFLDLMDFPPSVMTHYPKHQMLWAFEYLRDRRRDADAVPNAQYLEHLNAALDGLRTRCTTEAVAQHFVARCAGAA
jgi:hypothetical protein